MKLVTARLDGELEVTRKDRSTSKNGSQNEHLTTEKTKTQLQRENSGQILLFNQGIIERKT